MPRGSTYVNNAANRSLGRVGAPMGSMPVSRPSSGSTGGGYSSGGGYSGSHSTYVDNTYNRSVGRVGAPLGSVPMSRSSAGCSSDSTSSHTTYVDNAYNRSVGRAGAPLGSMPMSRSSAGSSSDSTSSHSTYVDNAYNRKVGRVGADLGSMSISKSSQGQGHKYHVDNALNRRLGRVGKRHGEAPHVLPKTEKRLYVDNHLNRVLDRVGHEVGTKPHSRINKNKRKETQPTHPMGEIYDKLFRNNVIEDFGDFRPDVPVQDQEYMVDKVLDLVRRMNQVEQWQKNNPGKQAQTAIESFKYDGLIIKFEEIELKIKIGSGGFGDVHFAKWNNSVVAVKKLRVQRVSQRRLKQFQEEVKVLCRLDHPHIVKFIGACIVTPNLAIVLEYMQKSLYETLHVEEVEYSDKEQHQIIFHMADGLAYLHKETVAHCDIKSTNILLDVPEDGVVAKISDFGLSMMKNETETSQSAAKVVQGVGTPKYSAPEVLAGEYLDQRAMCKADVYSMSLVAWEIICQEEPFFGLNVHQLKRQVTGGEGEVNLQIPDDIKVARDLLNLLKECWNRDAKKRPSSEQFKERVAKFGGIQ